MSGQSYTDYLLKYVLEFTSAFAYEMAGTSELEVVDAGRDSVGEGIEETWAE